MNKAIFDTWTDPFYLQILKSLMLYASKKGANMRIFRKMVEFCFIMYLPDLFRVISIVPLCECDVMIIAE